MDAHLDANDYTNQDANGNEHLDHGSYQSDGHQHANGYSHLDRDAHAYANMDTGRFDCYMDANTNENAD